METFLRLRSRGAGRKVELCFGVHGEMAHLRPGSNQVFVTLVVADPEPQKSVRSFQSESAIVQSDARGPDVLPPGFSDFLEL